MQHLIPISPDDERYCATYITLLLNGDLPKSASFVCPDIATCDGKSCNQRNLPHIGFVEPRSDDELHDNMIFMLEQRSRR